VSRRVRHHVNPFKLEHQRAGVGRVLLPSDPKPLEVEIGCADAEFLFQRAVTVPNGHYVGVEIREEWVDKVNARARSEGVENLAAVYANAGLDLEALFAPSSVDRFHLNFPDPWFKRRQRKRRLVTPELAAALARALRPGGELFFQSDVWDLALDAMGVLEEEPRLTNREGAWSFARANPFGAVSRRERVTLAKGEPVWRMRYLRGA